MCVCVVRLAGDAPVLLEGSSFTMCVSGPLASCTFPSPHGLCCHNRGRTGWYSTLQDMTFSMSLSYVLFIFWMLVWFMHLFCPWPLGSCLFMAFYFSNGHFIEFPNGRWKYVVQMYLKIGAFSFSFHMHLSVSSIFSVFIICKLCFTILNAIFFGWYLHVSKILFSA